ncbi:MAG: hypothetical protein J0L81_05405 [Caulobacterales bacterium]|jgi:hypothetical protein|nr:hypothetical protein [Caulobacterales bacterium]
MLSPNPPTKRAMNADQFLALAEALRSYARHSGRDINASNLFVHAMLMRAIQSDRPTPPQRAEKREAA